MTAMKAFVLLASALLTFSSVHASWVEQSYVDEMTDVETRGVYSNGFGARIGIECISEGSAKGRVRFEFGIGEIFATPSADIALKFRVDKNIPVDLKGRLFSNSHKAGFSYLDKLDPELQKDLLSQLISGSGYIVRYYKYGETLTRKGSLRGSKPRILKVLSRCKYEHFDSITEQLGLNYSEYSKEQEIAKVKAVETAEESSQLATAKAAADKARRKAAEARAKRNSQLQALQQEKVRYIGSIHQRVERKWIRPNNTDNVSCVVRARQIPGGEIIDVQVVSCSGGGAELERSVERAVLKSSPLPPVPDPRLFDRVLEFVFSPQ